MELTLNRLYRESSTPGHLYRGDELVCHTLEQPWKENRERWSCIPEGRYALQPQYTEDRGWHIEVCRVPARERVVMYASPDEDFLELENCIAPASEGPDPENPVVSRTANIRLKRLVFDAIERDEPVFIVIRTKPTFL